MNEAQTTDQALQAPPTDRVAASAPRAGSTYAHSLRTSTARWWKPVVGILGGVVLFLIASLALGAGAILLDTLVLGRPFDAQSLTPTMYTATLLSLVLLIPITLLMQRGVHGQRFGHLLSVDAGMRWGWLGSSSLVLLLFFALYMVAFQGLVPATGSRSEQWILYLLIAVLLMPFQAAAEEIFFRGYVQRAVGSWFSGEDAAFVVGTIVSALLFMAAHMAADPWLLAYYFTFGVTLSILARYTGGLEASIAIHAVNNVVAGAIGAWTTDPDRMFDRSVGVGGPFMLVQIVAIALCAVALVWWAHRKRLNDRVALATSASTQAQAPSQA